eukprot:CAMPEP_0202047516 /NCGR_PEP_ID=MMETSP0963-20130614/2011_1 /ASSEMBLY_ACC=CAM_ASM_000494 /TAXON_ID=4773 /ORGANISM="Schizochytrium aggregatum, Strain ATCC28209" /LENGTH=285 /DNA_ID=CAMNT_0048612279 /DNA_START=425 /DNA_END=1280 /DNA_ORIENTATION=+
MRLSRTARTAQARRLQGQLRLLRPRKGASAARARHFGLAVARLGVRLRGGPAGQHAARELALGLAAAERYLCALRGGRLAAVLLHVGLALMSLARSHGGHDLAGKLVEVKGAEGLEWAGHADEGHHDLAAAFTSNVPLRGRSPCALTTTGGGLEPFFAHCSAMASSSFFADRLNSCHDLQASTSTAPSSAGASAAGAAGAPAGRFAPLAVGASALAVGALAFDALASGAARRLAGAGAAASATTSAAGRFVRVDRRRPSLMAPACERSCARVASLAVALSWTLRR